MSCQVKLEKVKEPFPRFDVPPHHSIDSYFEYAVREGFEKRRFVFQVQSSQFHRENIDGNSTFGM
jgi:hypothetical protein